MSEDSEDGRKESHRRASAWIADLDAKQRALQSNVTIVVTDDEGRLQEYLEHLRVSQRRRLVYDIYYGIENRQEGADRRGVLMEDPLVRITNELRVSKGLTVVIKNVLSDCDLDYHPIHRWAVDAKITEQDNRVVLFLPSRRYVKAEVLSRSIVILPPISTEEERHGMAHRIARNFGIRLSTPTVSRLAQATAGLDLNQTEAALCTAFQGCRGEAEVDMAKVTKYKEDAINATGLIRFTTSVSDGFETVGGYLAVKDMIARKVIGPLSEPARAKALSMELPRGFILFGPGGTGKTVLAKALAKELGLPFVQISPEDYLSYWYGESEANLAQSIRLIEAIAPCVVFIDEIDRLGNRGCGDGESATTRRLFSQLLQWLGDRSRKAIVIGATNMPYLDEAFRREGRFDVMVPMLAPELEGREQILRVHLGSVRQVPNSLTSEDIAHIAAATSGWRGNMLEELVRRAVARAFQDRASVVTAEHMLAAYDDYAVNREALESSNLEFEQMARELCTSSELLASLVGPAEAQLQGCLRLAEGGDADALL